MARLVEMNTIDRNQVLGLNVLNVSATKPKLIENTKI